MACNFGSGTAFASRSMAELRPAGGLKRTVREVGGKEAAANVASFSAGVSPLSAMEKHS